jgi:membrane protease subunit HflK
MERNFKKIGIINLIALLAIGSAGAILAFYTNTLSGQVGLAFLGLGFLVAAISYFQMRLEETERLEKLEFEELNRDRGSASLFNVAEAEIFPAQRAREQFERVFVPAFTILLFLLQVGAVYWLSQWLTKVIPGPLKQPTVAMSLFGLFALVLFLLGKYSAGMARTDGAKLLRPGASYLLLGAYVCFVVTASLAAVEMGFPRVDLYVARAFAVVLALAATESLISLILEIYRPRVKGKAGRSLLESRLVGLLAQPEGLFTTAAQALDYQFGFKVSETWFYRFLEKALAWIVLVQLALLWLSTAFVFISPGEQGLLERFGRPLAGRAVLEPGLHLKLPWPADQVHRGRTREIQTFNIGFEPHDEKEREKVVLWTVPHYKEEFNLLVASRDRQSSGAAITNAVASEKGAPVDLLTASIPVQYRISDLRLWSYEHAEARTLLEKIATREVVRYFVGVDLFEIMSNGRAQASEDLKRRIQARAQELKLGAEIVLVGLQDIHPPVKVAKKFEEVNAARQETNATLHVAQGYASKTVALARANGEKAIREAEAYAVRNLFDAQARAAQFTNQIAASKASPEVFRQRAYLQALERGSTNARKYILAVTNTQDVFLLNLEDKVRPDLLDVPLPGARK